jgi:hypothetical protein
MDVNQQEIQKKLARGLQMAKLPDIMIALAHWAFDINMSKGELAAEIIIKALNGKKDKCIS